MDQDATWYGGRPRPATLCDVLPLPKKWAQPPPQFSAHVYCGQTAGWIKMALGTKVCSAHCVAWDPSPSPKGTQLPIFGPCLLWPNGRPSQLLLSTCSVITGFQLLLLYNNWHYTGPETLKASVLVGNGVGVGISPPSRLGVWVRRKLPSMGQEQRQFLSLTSFRSS